MEDKCYCLEILRNKFGDHIEGKCKVWSCGRYRIEQRKLKENKLKEENEDDYR